MGIWVCHLRDTRSARVIAVLDLDPQRGSAGKSLALTRALQTLGLMGAGRLVDDKISESEPDWGVCAAGRIRSCPITAPNSPRWRSCAGSKRLALRGNKSLLESRRRTPSSKASTGASGTSVSMTRCSRRSLRHAALSPHGTRITTATAPTRPSAA